VDVVALVGLVGSVEDEAPRLAADLGLTVYEAAMLLRAPPPTILLRTEDRSRTLSLLGNLRARGHHAVACDLAAVASSNTMFRPKSFRFEGNVFFGLAGTEERRLPLSEVVAFVRAMHATRSEDTVVKTTSAISIGRAVATGGLMVKKKTTTESKAVAEEREPVLYVFAENAAPWLLASTELRYDGLGEGLKRSRIENFDELSSRLRQAAPQADFDTRLLHARAPAAIVSSNAKHLGTSSAASIDVLAHIVAMAIRRSR
jgi:hypothetical protein